MTLGSTGITRARILLAALACAPCLQATRASAEPLLWSAELQAALPVAAPQRDVFGPGASASFGVEYPLLPQVLVGARVRGVGLLSGDPPSDPGRVDPGVGSFASASLTLRLRPLATAKGLRSTGFFVDGAFGAGITGEENRMGFEAGLGYGIDTGDLIFAPVLRYLQVVQGADPLSDEDARIAMLGFALTGGEDRKEAAPPPPPPPPPPADRDGDGIEDAMDRCPDDPEDHDGHADEDGCPDLDNDEDGLPDLEDDCPDEAEDIDGFQDEDGCPDPDNDQDGFLDPHDECPDEAEVVNGNLDYDGCPDEGLIEFKNDRIVLEERVLFDLERARVKRAGRPILRAIAELQRQHPEWVSIRIEGHADVRGNQTYNVSLSERRARNVRDALVRLGIPGDKIAAQGFGATRPRDMRDVEEAHQRNRRVEFVVLARIGGPEDETEQAEEAQEAGDEVAPQEGHEEGLDEGHKDASEADSAKPDAGQSDAGPSQEAEVGDAEPPEGGDPDAADAGGEEQRP